MKLDLNETERCEQAQVMAAAEAREATNRRRLCAVVIVCSFLVLLAGKSAIPHRPNGLFSRHLLGIKDKECYPPCLNGGACDTKTGSCNCPSGFSGSSCETSDIVDKCVNVFCLNGGACNPTTGLCVCSMGYTGDLCQVVVNKCANVLCLNGGACDTDTGKCVCPPGYAGDACQNLINKCLNVVCLNGGACDTGTGMCMCPSGYAGDKCQDVVNKCASVFCLNGGACNPANGKCVCSTGYTGDLCQVDERTCDPACIGNSFCTPTLVCQCNSGYMGVYPNCIRNYCANVPCQNGGMCVNGSNDYTCTCPPGYTGKNCQTLATEKVVFVTKQNWNGDLGGLAGADQKCQGAADGEGLSGTFKAWLSDGSQSAASRLSHSSYAYVLPNNGAKVADSWDDLVGEESLNARIDRNEEGGAESSRDVWTGTNKNGNKNGGFCDDWSSSVSSYEGMTGDNNHFDHEWTDNVEDDCDKANHLYCFQQ